MKTPYEERQDKEVKTLGMIALREGVDGNSAFIYAQDHVDYSIRKYCNEVKALETRLSEVNAMGGSLCND